MGHGHNRNAPPPSVAPWPHCACDDSRAKVPPALATPSTVAAPPCSAGSKPCSSRRSRHRTFGPSDLRSKATPVAGARHPVSARCGQHLHTRLAAFPSSPRPRQYHARRTQRSPKRLAASVCPHRGWRWGIPTPPPPPSVCPSNLSMATELASRRQLRDRAPMGRFVRREGRRWARLLES